jgi:glutathione synthase
MSLKVAVQMDPIASIKIKGDSTFALLLEAQARGCALFFYTPDSLAMLNGKVLARVAPISVRDIEGDHVTMGESIVRDLGEFDVILMRQDPPFDMSYITATHLLERLPARTQVINNPAHVRNAPEKIMVTLFPDLMPETLITRDKAMIEAFRKEFGAIVMKPLYGNGGAGVFKLEPDDPNFGSLFDMFTSVSREPWVIQKFLPEVVDGDKRIILVDGVPLGAVNRVPLPGDIRSNLVRGGAAETTQLSVREREICDRIGPVLKERGLLFTGIDVIAGNLTEINVTSPTGIRAIKRLGGPDLAIPIWDAIELRRRDLRLKS